MYNVGDRVSYKGDKGTIIFDDPKYHYRFTVQYDEGGFQGHTEEELEAAE